MLTWLTYHLEQENPGFFSPALTGFRAGLCTQDSLLLLHRLLEGRRRGRLKTRGILVAVDLKKAFDTAPHSAVLTALEETGVGTRIANCVRSFLTARSFEVTSASRHPKNFPNARGLPQGAVLSPVLQARYEDTGGGTTEDSTSRPDVLCGRHHDVGGPQRHVPNHGRGS